MITTLRSRVTLAVLAYMIFVATVIGLLGYVVNERFEEVIWRSTLEAELNSYLKYRKINPGLSAPTSGNLKTYISDKMDDLEHRPPDVISSLKPGLHDEISIDNRLYTVLVKDVDDHRIYMMYDITHLENQEHQLAYIVVASVVLVGGIIIFFGFWLGGKLSEPVRDLAIQLEKFNPRARGERVELRHQDAEINTIVTAINTYIRRLDGFVEREKEFVNTASHELRTPVAIISGAADVLKTIPNTPKKAVPPLARIQYAVSDMDEMINALLYLAREETSANQASMQTCRVDELLPKIVENHAYLLCDKEIDISMPNIEPTVVTAPPQLMSIVVSNLIRNAIEHTERGSVVIHLRSNILTVSNTMAIIAPDEIAKIYQGRIRNQDSGRSGKGLGLHIIERLSARVGWRFTLENDSHTTTTARLDMNARI